MNSTPSLILLIACAALARFTIAAADEGKPVKLSSMPEPAAAAIKKLAGKGKITRLTVEGHGEHTEYEAAVAGPKEASREVTVDAEGMLISTGEFIPLSRAPGIIRKVAAAAAAGGKLLTCQRIIENGETTFEVVIERHGKWQEVEFTRDGTLKEDADDGAAGEGAKVEKKVKGEQKLQKTRKEKKDDDEDAGEKKSEKREQKARKAPREKADGDKNAEEEKSEKREQKVRKEKPDDDEDSHHEKVKPGKAQKEPREEEGEGDER